MIRTANGSEPRIVAAPRRAAPEPWAPGPEAGTIVDARGNVIAYVTNAYGDEARLETVRRIVACVNAALAKTGGHNV
jgi:hypothetical protein